MLIRQTFGTTADDDFDPIYIGGTDITITGAPGHVIDGNGAAYWDGEGSNGGSAKYVHHRPQCIDYLLT